MNLPEALVNANFKRIAAFAAKHKMPAMYSDQSAIDVNGLMFYGPNYIGNLAPGGYLRG